MINIISGVIVILVATLMRIPQIFYVIKHNNVDGISFETFTMKNLVYSMTTIYYYKNHYQLILYGENVILLITTTFLLFAMMFVKQFKEDPTCKKDIKIFMATVVISSVMASINDLTTIAYMQTVIITVDFISNVPQIYKLFKEKNAGNLDMGMFVLSAFGNTTRTYSLLINEETKNDATAILGSVIGIVTNTVMILQITWYRYAKPYLSNMEEIIILNSPVVYRKIEIDMEALSSPDDYDDEKLNLECHRIDTESVKGRLPPPPPIINENKS